MIRCVLSIPSPLTPNNLSTISYQYPYMKLFLTGIAAFSALSAFASDYYEKEVVFPQSADSITKIEIASRLVPCDRQMRWQERELTAFLHFGMNTFTNREWGDGKESPEFFNPDALDTDQWVKTLKDAGFKMVILTAKHHDGFCLWPTATTDHSVASSPWRGGKGDVMAELRRSCDKYGMKLGVYLSPWDRNAPCYGDSPRYNDMFVAQLTELLTNYGKIDEVWFDGACGEGPNGKKQEYDWLRFRDTMKRLQPDAVLAITGDDVRWVGNEGGVGRETEWSVTPLVPSIFSYADSVNQSLGIDAISPEIGSRRQVVSADKLYWWPSEVDVSIRPGWFWHENEVPHSLARLADIYLKSVGRNSVLLLNIPPDNHGLIDQKDVRRLMEFRRWIDANFTNNLLNKPGSEVNCVVLEEDISKGQRVEEFDVIALVDGRRIKAVSGTTIGKKRILTFPPVRADRLELKVTASRAEPHASLSGAYFITMPSEISAESVEMPAIEITDNWRSSTARTGSSAVTMFDMGVPTVVAGFTYTPDAKKPMMYKYAVMSSADGIHWTEVPTYGEFSNIVANPIPRTVTFASPVTARFISVVCLVSSDGKPYNPVPEAITLRSPLD